MVARAVHPGHGIALGLFFLAVYLWLGSFSRRKRLVAGSVYAAFAFYGLITAARGAEDCGCFGGVQVSPWWTFLGDLLVAVGLLSLALCVPAERRSLIPLRIISGP